MSLCILEERPNAPVLSECGGSALRIQSSLREDDKAFLSTDPSDPRRGTGQMVFRRPRAGLCRDLQS